MGLYDECRVLFKCPKCGIKAERYGKTLSEIKFGTCVNCGYEEKECDNGANDKIKKEQTVIRTIGLILIIVGVIFFPISFLVHYSVLGISSILVTIGVLMLVRSLVHVKYNNSNKKSTL